MIIKSSAALRNDYGVISALAHEEAEPIDITENGEDDLVVTSTEAFEERDEALKLRAKLEAAAARQALQGIPLKNPNSAYVALSKAPSRTIAPSAFTRRGDSC